MYALMLPIEKLVKKFEDGSLLPREWHHAEHLAVCFWYLCQLPFQEVVYRLKLGILKYNEIYKVPQTPERGYHETITLFFIFFTKKYLEAEKDKERDFSERINTFLSAHGEFLPLLHRYYSKPLLNSLDARTRWVEPDLERL